MLSVALLSSLKFEFFFKKSLRNLFGPGKIEYNLIRMDWRHIVRIRSLLLKSDYPKWPFNVIIMVPAGS